MKLFKPKTKRREMPGVTGPFKVNEGKPPVWESVRNTFQIEPTNAVFTYGDTIYNPNKLHLPSHIIEHERVHMKQQNNNDKDAALWWGRYLREPAFRIEQEARAYAVQYDFICQVIHDRNERARIRMDLARILSGPLYQNAIGLVDAEKLIHNLSKTKP